MPFALTNALSAFMNLTNTVFKNYLYSFVIVFIYGMVAYHKSENYHTGHLGSDRFLFVCHIVCSYSMEIDRRK